MDALRVVTAVRHLSSDDIADSIYQTLSRNLIHRLKSHKNSQNNISTMVICYVVASFLRCGNVSYVKILVSDRFEGSLRVF